MGERTPHTRRGLRTWPVIEKLNLLERLRGAMQFEPFDLLSRVLEGHGRARYDLSSSDMPPQMLSEYGGLADRSLAEHDVGGGDGLRGELARLYGGHPKDYIITAGASEANFAAFAALLSPGDRVLVERPVYQPLDAIPRALGGIVHVLPRPEASGFRLSAQEVHRAAPKGIRLLVLSNLNNPTGSALAAEEVHGIADLAMEKGFHVLVDETFRDLAFDRTPPTIGGMNEHTIVTAGVSKFYGAGGLRIGWLRAAPEVRKRVRNVLDYLSVAPSGPSEAIALSLLRNRERTVSRNRRLITGGRRIAAEWAASAGIAWSEPVAHLAFPRVGGDTVRLAEVLLRDHETFIAPGETFGLGGHFRLNLGIPGDVLAEGLARVTKARGSLEKAR